MGWTILAVLLAADPAGTVTLDLVVGRTAPIETKPPASVICDDVSVVRPEFSEDGNGFVLRALRPGSTLCGVWLADQVPGGLYRVNVSAQATPDAGAKH
ncbi:MAG: hypothetical protein ABR567_07720 [Myxococcales bacterium]|nr:hypothetical protein [Myxococcales bacterium]